jgi:phage tail sheath protein FI
MKKVMKNLLFLAYAASYQTPGQFIEEVEIDRTIQGAGTSTGAFAGVTEKGRFGSFLVTSWNKFKEEYGGYINDSYLAYAVKGFFDNGGTRAYISRVVHYSTGAKTSAKATANLTSGASDVVANIDAISDGVWGNGLAVKIENWSNTDKTFDISITFGGSQVENPIRTVTLETLEEKINGSSKLITVTVLDDSASLTNGTYVLANGNDGLSGLTSTDYVGDASLRNGIQAFSNEPINLIAVPGVTDTAVLSGLEAFCLNRRVYAITETAVGKTPSTAVTFKTTASVSIDRMAMYYPWIQVADPIGFGDNPQKLIPPSGHVMGVYARTDSTRGVFKAPAGEVEGKLVGITGLEYNTDDDEQAILTPAGINAIRALTGAGIVVWGTRSVAAASSKFRYIPVRRSADYVEESIKASTRWSTFEPNDSQLYGKLQSAIEAFLRPYWKSGALKGKVESDAFFVRCDDNTTTEDEANNGYVYAEVGIATVKPAEFIIFRVQVR